MTNFALLSAALSQRILYHFELPADPPPTLSTLRRLVNRYTRTVPWESASRIVRRSRQVESTDCILLGEAFWESHFADRHWRHLLRKQLCLRRLTATARLHRLFDDQ